jgi:tight adherence protein C
VAERGPAELRSTFAEVVARMDAGEPLAVALPRLVTTVGEPARALVRAVVTAEQDGSPVRSVLGRLADDARRQRRQDLDAAVRRLPVRLTFPLALCALPAFVLLTVVPLLAAGLRRMGPLVH